MSKGHSQPRTQLPRRNALGKCKNKVSTDNTVIIDVEKGKTEVVDVDEPEPSHQWSRNPGKTSTKTFPDGIISIDDDDDEEDGSNCNARDVHGPHGDATCQMFNARTRSSFCDNFDQNEGSKMFGNGKHPLEQEKRDYPGSSRNHFGLGSDFDSSQSESDSSEFETSEMESDSSDCEILEDVSGTIREQWERAANKKRMLGRNRQASEDEASTTDSSAGFHSRYSSEKIPDYVNYDNETINRFEEIHVSFSTSKADNQMNGSCRSASGGCKEEPSRVPVKVDAAFVSEHGVQPTDGVPSSCTECSNNNDRGSPSLGSFPFYSSLHHNIRSAKEGVLHDKGQPSNNSAFAAAREAESSFQANDRPSADKDVEPGFQESSPGSPLCLKTQKKEDHLVVGPSQHNLDSSNGNEICGIDEGAVPRVANDLVAGREKHKDSDEYKRAVEEEWASRRRELQMQAEEAQRLKKRRKAESLRLLDMEKRQRQRIEEIRETQKKDEETIHLKEKFRVEVRRELDKIEATYKDMASVLRALGIPVGSSPFPLSHEVNNAYKKALLRFHPDRASRTNVREQVEAEEKFKLISRLKDKLLCASMI